jgi:2-polyprenyl-3-methyl-5-hydroxy-6-metoxy-1,4-benzoquinol methylase
MSEPGRPLVQAAGPERSSCRFCGTPLAHTFLDLGATPPANRYLDPGDLRKPEPYFPLQVYVCGSCFLVQLEAVCAPEDLFGDYAYFSSYSNAWLRHAEAYVEQVIGRFGIGPRHQVVEVASNDGYLLQYFCKRGVPALGIEPAANVAQAAMAKGIPTLVRFFGRETARALVRDGQAADLLIGNNVLAHVPDLNDFVAGIAIALKASGVATLEFPHLLALMRETQFDTIYHEHFSYFSFTTVGKVFAAHGLRLFDVERLPTHGGSLRIYACHTESDHRTSPAVAALRDEETLAGLHRLATYGRFEERVQRVKRQLLRFLLSAKEEGRSVVGYGAPAKGNTLLNYCGVRRDLLDYTVDRSPHKQGRYLPGTRIPVYAPERIAETRPDYVLILPWNLTEEITAANACVREWGGRFVVPIPELKVLP